MTHQADIDELLRLSARIGSNPLLIQASSGNTSIKLDNTLWIKASGKWLAQAAEENILVPLSLLRLQWSLHQNAEFGAECTDAHGSPLRASIETAMHAVLPYRVVIHVHSVNTLSWAIRLDGAERLSERLSGLHWQWIPYTLSGIPLARAIEKALEELPVTNIFILANHGLVICGQTCAEAEALLHTVENRLRALPRNAPEFDSSLLTEIGRYPQWKLPEVAELHALATDQVSCRILTTGVLYPCQAIFLAPKIPVVPSSARFSEAVEQVGQEYEKPPFWIVEGKGVIVDKELTKTQYAVLCGLLQVISRTEETAPLHYLSDSDLIRLMTQDAHAYQQCAERNAARCVS